MGIAKAAMMEEQDSLIAMAYDLVKLGYLKECADHGILYDTEKAVLSDDTAIEHIWMKHKQTSFANIPESEFFDLVRSAWQDNCASSCSMCLNNKYS